MVTEVVDVEIGVADKPHYIALSSGKPIIWRFTGRIDAISRVVVLGSQFNGTTRSGVVGVPHDRILFVKTDMEKMEKRMQVRSSCDSFYWACEASAYFDISKADRMELAGDAPSERYGVDQFVERVKGDVVRIPQDGWVEERGAVQKTASGWQIMPGRHESASGEGYVETSQNYERGLIKIDAASVVSPETIRDYSILPGVAGIRQLLADGSLIGPDDARFKAAYDRWNERISRPYRSRLDPDFLLSYKVNYLTTRPMTLPAGLNRVALLVGEGVEAPDMNSNHYMACLYYADLRDIQVDPHKSRDPRCMSGPPFLAGSLVLSESDRQIATVALSLDRIQQASQADKDKCGVLTVAGDAYFAGISVSESAAFRPSDAVPRRRIDVIVKRPGKVALYLEKSNGRTDWHILPSAQTQITNVVLSQAPLRLSRVGGSLVEEPGQHSEIRGLDPSVPIQTIPRRPAVGTGSDCDSFRPPRHAYLGGPAALLLDQDLQVLAGRGLDSLLRNTNDGSWPPVVSDQDAPRVSLVIE
jgi:hypothetical protein